MAVKVDKLWSDMKFQLLSDRAKLLYLYLATSKDISVVGTLSPNIQVIGVELRFSLDEIREATKELRDNKYIVVSKVDNITYFIVPNHFNTVPKSQSSILKIQNQLESLPSKIVNILKGLNIKVDAKVTKFKKPTAKEVTDYAASKGYIVNGEEFVTYYDDQSDRHGRKNVWVDGRGTIMRDWRAKVRKVWCKEENEIKKVDGAPKGFETFYVEIKGSRVYPDSWKNGKPHSKDFTSDFKLKKEYEKRKRDSN